MWLPADGVMRRVHGGDGGDAQLQAGRLMVVALGRLDARRYHMMYLLNIIFNYAKGACAALKCSKL